MAMNRPDYWLTRFSKLRTDRAQGDPAPHRPLLLLALCGSVEKASLSATFYTYRRSLHYAFT